MNIYFCNFVSCIFVILFCIILEYETVFKNLFNIYFPQERFHRFREMFFIKLYLCFIFFIFFFVITLTVKLTLAVEYFYFTNLMFNCPI